jgi:UDP-2,3-diacylglucosamine hydrolase
MTTFFISDLHLDASRPQITKLFLEFLENEAPKADALYILGDLFEAWIGDDAPDQVGDLVAEGLASLHNRGVPCFFIHGNRDFLIGDAYARRARLTLLADSSVIEVAHERILIMHGDSLCTDDVVYQEFKLQVRNPAWQKQFLSSPIAERQHFASLARAESRQHTLSTNDFIMDVNQTATRAALREHSVRTLVHGHTHRPAFHEISDHELEAQRIVLGDWYEQGGMLVFNPSDRRLVPIAA